MIFMTWLPGLLFLGAFIYLGARFVQAMEKRAAAQEDVRALEKRVSQLEDALADASANLQRLSEGQEFTTRLLTERASEQNEPE